MLSRRVPRIATYFLPKVSITDIRIAVPDYDPKQWRTLGDPNQMDCSVNLALPSQSPGRIELTWKRDITPSTAGGNTRH